MKKSLLTILVLILGCVAMAQTTAEENKSDIQKLQKKINALKRADAKLKENVDVLQTTVSLQAGRADSLGEALETAGALINDNENALKQAEGRIEAISSQSGEMSSSMNRNTRYVSMGMLTLLLVMVIGLFVVNLRRKKEAGNLSDKISKLESETRSAVEEMKIATDQKFSESESRSAAELVAINSTIEKQSGEWKNALRNMEKALSEKIDAKSKESAATAEAAIAKAIEQFDTESAKIRSELEKLVEVSISRHTAGSD